MNKADLCKIFERIPTPISQIEKEWGIPATTLQKAIKGERKLPKKWALVVAEKLVIENNKPENKARIEEKRETVMSDETKVVMDAGQPLTEADCIPPIPTRNPGEDAFDFAARKNEWKKLYGQ